MYLVRAKIKAVGEISPDNPIYWEIDQTEWVQDSLIGYYTSYPDAFEILDGPILTETTEKKGKMASAFIDFNDVGEAEMTVTIGGVVYAEAEVADAPNGVFTNGATAADSATSLISALNGDTRASVPFTAVADESGDGVWLFWDAAGTEGNVTITTTSAANCTVQNSTGGEDAATRSTLNIKHTVNAQELLSGAIEIPVPFTPAGFHLSAFSATGAPIVPTDLVTIEATPDRIKITTTGATSLANTDVIYLTVFE